MATPFAKTKSEHNTYKKDKKTHKVYWYGDAIHKGPPTPASGAAFKSVTFDERVNEDSKYIVRWSVTDKVLTSIKESHLKGFKVQVESRIDYKKTDGWYETANETVGKKVRKYEFTPDSTAYKARIKVTFVSEKREYAIRTYKYDSSGKESHTDEKKTVNWFAPVDSGWKTINVEPTDPALAPAVPTTPEVIANIYNSKATPTTGKTEMTVRTSVENPDKIASVKIYGRYIKNGKIYTLKMQEVKPKKVSNASIGDYSPYVEATFKNIPRGVVCYYFARSVSKATKKTGKAYVSAYSENSKNAISMMPRGTAIGGYVISDNNVKVMYEKVDNATKYIIAFSPSLEELYDEMGPTYGTYVTENAATMAYINPNNTRDLIYMRYAAIRDDQDLTQLTDGKHLWYPTIKRVSSEDGGYDYIWGGASGSTDTVNDSVNPITAAVSPDYPSLWSLYSTRKYGESIDLYATNNSRTGAPAKECQFHIDIIKVYEDGSTDSILAEHGSDLLVQNENKDPYGNVIDGAIRLHINPQERLQTWDAEPEGDFSHIKLVWWAVMKDINGFTSPEDCPRREVLFFPEPTVDVTVDGVTPVTDEDKTVYPITSYPINLTFDAHPSGQKPISYVLTVKSNDTYLRDTYYGSDEQEVVLEGELMYSQYITPTSSDNTEHYSIDPGKLVFESGKSYTIGVTVTMQTGLTSQESQIEIQPTFDNKKYTIGYVYDSDPEDCVCDIIPWCIDYADPVEGSKTITTSAYSPTIRTIISDEGIIDESSMVMTIGEDNYLADLVELPNYVTTVRPTEFVRYTTNGNFIFDTYELSKLETLDEYGITTYIQNGIICDCLVADTVNEITQTLNTLNLTAGNFDTILLKQPLENMYRSVRYDATTRTVTYDNTFTAYDPTTGLIYISSANDWTDNKILVENYTEGRYSPVICNIDSSITANIHKYLLMCDFGRYIGQNTSIDLSYYYAGSDVYISDADDERLSTDAVLSVYRINADRSTTLIQDNIPNDRTTVVTDYHPSLKNSSYRIVAMSNTSGDMSVIETEPETLDSLNMVIQWGTRYKLVETITGDLEVEEDYKQIANTVKVPYNIDVSETTSIESELVKYIGRERPVAYYGIMRDEAPVFNFEIPKTDIDTLTKLRALSIYPGNVYIREPSGLGYWCNVKVSWGITHCELTIPVTINAVPVEGGN